MPFDERRERYQQINVLRRNSLLEWRQRFMEHLSQQKADADA